MIINSVIAGGSKTKQFTFTNQNITNVTSNSITNYYYTASGGSTSGRALNYIDLSLSELNFIPNHIRVEATASNGVVHWEEYIERFSETHILRGNIDVNKNVKACLRLGTFYNSNAKTLRFMTNDELTNCTINVYCYL